MAISSNLNLKRSRAKHRISIPIQRRLAIEPEVHHSLEAANVLLHRNKNRIKSVVHPGQPAEFAPWYSRTKRRIVCSKKSIHKDDGSLELVMGGDDRISISPTTAYPWRCICSIDVFGGKGVYWSGTGWIAGPRLVITAGHVVFPHQVARWPNTIWVSPGADGLQSPYGSSIGMMVWAHPRWVNYQDSAYDIGAIILPESIQYGQILGSFGILIPDDSTLKNCPLNLCGYPADRPYHTLWYHSRIATLLSPDYIFYDIDTAGGQSGSPIWVRYKNHPFIVGIHTTGSVTGNSAVRLDSDIFNMISLWNSIL